MEALSIFNGQLPQQSLRFPLRSQQPRYNHHHLQLCHFHRRRRNHINSLPTLSISSPHTLSLSRWSISAYSYSSSSSSSSNGDNISPIAKTPKTLNPSFSSLLKLPLCIAVAAAALFFSRFPVRPLPALAEPAVTAENEEAALSKEERREFEAEKKVERAIEEHLVSNPNDAVALKSLMEIKMKNKDLPKAIEIASRLLELQPYEVEWRLLRGHMYCYMGDLASAQSEFESIIKQYPNQVEAFHGLVMAVSQVDSRERGKMMDEVEERIKEAMESCKREKLKDEVREFKLLLAQIRFVEGDYNDALKVYQDLVKEEPRDYRPYLCQGIIYTLLRNKDEAEKQFNKYKRLMPSGHPYAKYFEDAVKTSAGVFSQMAGNARDNNRS